MTMVSFSLLHLLLIAVASSVLPGLTRPDLFFAVTVAPGFGRGAVGRAIVQRYRGWGWAGTALLALGVVGLGDRAAAFVAATAGGVVVWAGAFVVARRATRPFAVAPAPVRTALLTMRRDGVPGGTAALLLPLVILAVRAGECFVRWEEIPLRFPIHWGWNGADRWAEKTAWAVSGLFGAMGLLCGVLLFLAWAMVHRARRVTGAEQHFRNVGVAGLMALGWTFALTLPPIENMALAVPFGPGLIGVVAAGWLVALVRTGQGGARLPGYASLVDGTAPVGDRTADGSWKLGLFYVNRGDPALLVEKRFGLGWTLNFGHPLSWLVVAAVVGGPLVLRLIA
jgi:uncharacterized membrane protein